MGRQVIIFLLCSLFSFLYVLYISVCRFVNLLPVQAPPHKEDGGVVQPAAAGILLHVPITVPQAAANLRSFREPVLKAIVAGAFGSKLIDLVDPPLSECRDACQSTETPYGEASPKDCLEGMGL